MARGPRLSEGNDIDDAGLVGVPTGLDDDGDKGMIKARGDNVEPFTPERKGKREDREEAPESRSVEEIENDGFWKEPEDDRVDISEVIEKPDADPEASEAEPEIEAAPEAEAEVEEEPAGRANKRIRGLIEERNELKETLRALQQTQADQLAFQRQQQADYRQAQADQRRQREEIVAVETMRNSGMNDEQIQYVLATRAKAAENAGLGSKLEAMEQRLARQDEAAQVQRYEQALGAHLLERLGDRNVTQAQVQKLYKSARAIAAAEQLADPAEAVAMALDPVLEFLPKKAPIAAKGQKINRGPPVDPRADKAVNGGTRKGAAAVGDRAGGSKPRKNIEQIEREMRGGRSERNLDWGHG